MLAHSDHAYSDNLRENHTPSQGIMGLMKPKGTKAAQAVDCEATNWPPGGNSGTISSKFPTRGTPGPICPLQPPGPIPCPICPSWKPGGTPMSICQILPPGGDPDHSTQFGQQEALRILSAQFRHQGVLPGLSSHIGLQEAL